jgi:hypothetical protein
MRVTFVKNVQIYPPYSTVPPLPPPPDDLKNAIFNIFGNQPNIVCVSIVVRERMPQQK